MNCLTVLFSDISRKAIEIQAWKHNLRLLKNRGVPRPENIQEMLPPPSFAAAAVLWGSAGEQLTAS